MSEERIRRIEERLARLEKKVDLVYSEAPTTRLLYNSRGTAIAAASIYPKKKEVHVKVLVPAPISSPAYAFLLRYIKEKGAVYRASRRGEDIERLVAEFGDIEECYIFLSKARWTIEKMYESTAPRSQPVAAEARKEGEAA